VNLNARQRKFKCRAARPRSIHSESPPFLSRTSPPRPFEPLAGKRGRGEGQKRPPAAKDEQETTFLAGAGWAVTAKIPSDFFADLTPTQSATHHYLPEPLPSDSGMFDPDGKGLGKTTDLITTIPGFRPRIRARVVFHLGKGKRLGDAFAGLLRVFWLTDKGHKISKACYKSGIFGWFPRGSPAGHLHRLSSTAKLRPRRSRGRNSCSNCSLDGSCDSQLLLVSFQLVHFFWQGFSQDFKPLIDQSHPD
jgi:hypothetical protein